MATTAAKKNQLALAIINVMKAVKGVEKTMTVGSGNYSYKGVSDQEVKKTYNKAMTDNGLCILPIDIQESTDIHRWVDSYGKQKLSAFTKVTTKYLLLHESGESREISGYGHGIDSGDKGAGKATTYALKYALLYTFLTPTGKIDDSDTHHSEEAEAPELTKDDIVVRIGNCKTKAELSLLGDWIKHFKLNDVANTKFGHLKS